MCAVMTIGTASRLSLLRCLLPCSIRLVALSLGRTFATVVSAMPMSTPNSDRILSVCSIASCFFGIASPRACYRASHRRVHSSRPTTNEIDAQKHAHLGCWMEHANMAHVHTFASHGTPCLDAESGGQRVVLAAHAARLRASFLHPQPCRVRMSP
jgi:hypothetical protein